MTEYLNDRITALTQSHKNFQKEEARAKDPSLKSSYNSQAAGVWDTKCEVEAILAEYNKVHPNVDSE